MEWLLDRIRQGGSLPCVATADREYSFADLDQCIDAAISQIGSSGIAAGDVVALFADFSLTGIAWFLALARRRVALVPITSSTEAEAASRLASAQVQWRVDILDGRSPRITLEPGHRLTHPLLLQLRERNRAGLILFSSGSCGPPKAMAHDLTSLVDSYALRRPRHLRVLLFLLFDHIGGLNTLLLGLAGLLCLVVPHSREPGEIAALIAKRQVNVLPASPTFLNLLLLSGAPDHCDLSSLRIITYGTEPMPQPLLARLRLAFPKVKFLQTFGTSETGISQTSSESSGSTWMRIDDPNVEVRVVEGELWLRSKTQILGYLNYPMHNFTSDGWFKTGDLVETSSDGSLRIIGRQSSLINIGGLKVLPEEVEAVLLEMPEIADCVVFGEANPITGQAVVAQIVLSPGADPNSIKSLMRAHCRARLAPYKIPIRLRISDRTSFSGRFKKMRAAGADPSLNPFPVLRP